MTFESVVRAAKVLIELMGGIIMGLVFADQVGLL